MARKKIDPVENETDFDAVSSSVPEMDVPSVEIPQPAPSQPVEAAPTVFSLPHVSAAPPPAPPVISQPRAGRRKPEGVVLTAIYHFILGLPFLLVGMIILLIPVPAVLFTVDETVPLTLALIALALVIFTFFLCGLIPIIAGIGLLRMRNWARWLAISIALLSLLFFPLGTLTGALVLVYLLTDSVRREFTGE